MADQTKEKLDNKEVDLAPLENDSDLKTKKRKEEFIKIIKYVLCAASAAAVQLGTNAILYHWILRNNAKYQWIAYTISLILSVIWNLTINKKFTFKSSNNIKIAMLEVLAFYAVFTPVSSWWTKVLEQKYPSSLAHYIILACTMVLNLILEYLLFEFVVFRKTKKQKEQEKQLEEENLNKDNQIQEEIDPENIIDNK